MIFDGAFVAKVLNCENLSPQLLKRDICSVCIDSRKWEAGALFLALIGERVDGHFYISSLVEQGCRDFIVLTTWFEENEDQCKEYEEVFGATFFKVGDTLLALQDLAEAYRRLFSDLVVIGVTGSNGKTTVKELLASIFSGVASTVWNEGNLNSEIGLPLSVFAIRPEHRYAIFEMGINHKGEMDILSRVAKPETVIVTNIGSAHIGELGSREAIALEKRKAFSFFNKDSAAIIPQGDDFADFLLEGLTGEAILFGESCEPAFEAVKADDQSEGLTFMLDGKQVLLPLSGRHNIGNALAAVKVARHYGIDFSDIRFGLENVKPISGRSELIRGRFLVIKDCYNANPESMKKALELLEVTGKGSRKIAVLADMFELGHESENAHRDMGLVAGAMGFNAIFFFGKEMSLAFDAYKSVSGKSDSFWFDDYIDMKESIVKYIKDGDTILLKGSRSMKLERLVDVLL